MDALDTRSFQRPATRTSCLPPVIDVLVTSVLEDGDLAATSHLLNSISPSETRSSTSIAFLVCQFRDIVDTINFGEGFLNPANAVGAGHPIHIE